MGSLGPAIHLSNACTTIFIKMGEHRPLAALAEVRSYCPCSIPPAWRQRRMRSIKRASLIRLRTQAGSPRAADCRSTVPKRLLRSRSRHCGRRGPRRSAWRGRRPGRSHTNTSGPAVRRARRAPGLWPLAPSGRGWRESRDAPLTWRAPFGNVGAPPRLGPVVSGGEVVGKGREDVLVDIFPRLPIHAGRPTPFVGTHRLPDPLEEGPLSNHLPQRAKPLGGIGRCQLAELFQVAMWVTHEVAHLCTHMV